MCIQMTKSHIYMYIHVHSKAHKYNVPSVCAGGCSSEGTDGGTGDTLDTADSCFPAALIQELHVRHIRNGYMQCRL